MPPPLPPLCGTAHGPTNPTTAPSHRGLHPGALGTSRPRSLCLPSSSSRSAKRRTVRPGGPPAPAAPSRPPSHGGSAGTARPAGGSRDTVGQAEVGGGGGRERDGPDRPAPPPAPRGTAPPAQACARGLPPYTHTHTYIHTPPPRDGSFRTLPVPPGGQQGPAQLRAQLPQRWLRPLNLQRRRSLLYPHPELHGGGGGSPSPPSRPRSGPRRVAAMVMVAGGERAQGLPGRVVVLVGAAPPQTARPRPLPGRPRPRGLRRFLTRRRPLARSVRSACRGAAIDDWGVRAVSAHAPEGVRRPPGWRPWRGWFLFASVIEVVLLLLFSGGPGRLGGLFPPCLEGGKPLVGVISARWLPAVWRGSVGPLFSPPSFSVYVPV